MFPFSLHLSISSWLAVEAFSVTIDTNLIRRPKSQPCNKNDSNNKRTHKTKVGGDRKRLHARIEKNHQKRTPQEVYRLLLLISRSAAAGEKGKQKKNRETQGKVPQVSGASSAEDAVASAHITDRMLAT